MASTGLGTAYAVLFLYMDSPYICSESCFQSVKDIKFESNSQQVVNDARRYRGCFLSVKDIKFESNSQPST